MAGERVEGLLLTAVLFSFSEFCENPSPCEKEGLGTSSRKGQPGLRPPFATALAILQIPLIPGYSGCFRVCRRLCHSCRNSHSCARVAPRPRVGKLESLAHVRQQPMCVPLTQVPSRFRTCSRCNMRAWL